MLGAISWGHHFFSSGCAPFSFSKCCSSSCRSGELGKGSSRVLLPRGGCDTGAASCWGRGRTCARKMVCNQHGRVWKQGACFRGTWDYLGRFGMPVLADWLGTMVLYIKIPS